jgi:AcrR family transcriptional regulator
MARVSNKLSAEKSAQPSARALRKPHSAASDVAQFVSVQQSTKSMLMDAGEQLIGRHGFDGVTLRDISELAGQANSSVVQYHFKDKSGLVEAILADRMRRRERLRKERFEALRVAGELSDPRRLVEAVWQPLLAFQDEAGRYVFCHFALQCLLRTDFHERYPAYEVFEIWHKPRRSTASNSVLAEVLKCLQRHYVSTPLPVLARRLSALSLMFITNVVAFDNTPPKIRDAAKFGPKPFVDMAICALAAPQ